MPWRLGPRAQGPWMRTVQRLHCRAAQLRLGRSAPNGPLLALGAEVSPHTLFPLPRPGHHHTVRDCISGPERATEHKHIETNSEVDILIILGLPSCFYAHASGPLSTCAYLQRRRGALLLISLPTR